MTCSRLGHALATPSPRRRLERLSLCAAVAFAVAFAAAKPAGALNYFCRAGDVACLISAIHSANQDFLTDSIYLDSGTYDLTGPDNTAHEGPNGLPVITTPIQIFGAGPDATVIQRPSTTSTHFRIFQVAASGILTLNSLGVSGGWLDFSSDPSSVAGAGILNLGAAALSNVTLQNNREFLGGLAAGGAGIRNLGNLAVYGSLLYQNSSGGGNGGGILNVGTMVVYRSSIRANFAFQGGGVASGNASGTSTGTITYSDIVGNNSPSSSGVFSLGGLTISGTTIANNLTQGIGNVTGAIVSVGGVLHLENATVSSNHTNFSGGLNTGGILNNGGTVELRNTILAKNILSVGGTENPSDCGGPVSSLGHNLVGSTVGCGITLLSSDLQGDPGLGVFTDGVAAGDYYVRGNGRLPLLPGSRAIDAGDPGFGGPVDQLFFPRADGDLNGTATCDIGAIEFEPVVNGFITLMKTDSFRDGRPVDGFPAGTETISSQYRNTGSEQITRPVFVVAKLSNKNMLLNCDPPAPGGAGARLTPNVGTDLVWSPGETINVQFVIGLKNSGRYTFDLDVIGYPQ